MTQIYDYRQQELLLTFDNLDLKHDFVCMFDQIGRN